MVFLHGSPQLGGVWLPHIFNSVTEQIEDLTMRLEGPQGPPGAGFPGAPGEPGPQGPQGALFLKKSVPRRL